jgi:hypothetical protein
MHRLRLRKPSPAMVIALVALFAALGGTAVATTFGPFKGDKIIKKGSLSGNRLKKGTLTGTQINLGKLGTVPNASHAGTADSATTANTANTANTATTVSQIHKVALVTANAGQTVSLATFGPFVFTLKCTNPSGTVIAAAVDVATSVDHTSFESKASAIEGDFLISTGAIAVTDSVSSANPASSDFDGDGGAFSAVDTNNNTYIGTAFAGARIRGHDCVGGMTVIN